MIEEIKALLADIRAQLDRIEKHVSHCPTMRVREVFDREFQRKEVYDESSGEIITTQGEP
jgi:hypothetical protein